MTFKTQLETDRTNVFFNTSEFAESATLTTIDDIDYVVSIVRTGEVERFAVEPGQADMDTFELENSASYVVSPNDKITTADGVVWLVQTGVRYDEILGIWTVPVISAGRLKS